MSFIINPLQPVRCYVRVNLRRSQVRVAKQFLDAAKVRASVEHVCGIAVAQLVWRHLWVEAGQREIFFQTGLQRPRRHWSRLLAPAKKTGESPQGNCGKR